MQQAYRSEGTWGTERRAFKWELSTLDCIPGISDGDPQRRHHVPDAGGLEERGPEQHHQADSLHHGGLPG